MTHPLEPDTMQAQGRQWRAERIGWTLMAVILLAGLLGAFGGGPLAHRRLHSGSLELAYDQTVRSNAPAHLELAIGRTINGDPVRVWLRQDYMAAVQLQHVVPQPVRSYSDSGRLVMDFTASPGRGPYTISLEIEPNRIGSHSAALGVGGDSIRFSQLVLP